MNQYQLMTHLEAIIDTARSAALAYTDLNNTSQMRWMTPTILMDDPRAIYAVTRPGSPKVKALESHPDVEWMFQTLNLGEIINLHGTLAVIDNPSLNSEVMQKLATRLNVLWKVDTQNTDFVVLETIITKAVYYLPMKAHWETLIFDGE